MSRATFSALFAVIGTAYGAGDGSTTFAVPDLRGRVPAGKDNMGGTAANRLTSGGSGVNGATLGATGGAETHVLSSAQIPAHTHALSGNGAWIDAPGVYAVNAGGSTVNMNRQTATGSIGNDSAHNNTQPTLVANYIIKA